MHSECSSTARTGIVRFADDPGPHPLYCLRHRPDQSLGRFQMLDQNQDYTVVWGLREGEAVQAENCFLTLTWDGEWDQWRSISPGDPFPLDFFFQFGYTGGISEPRRLLHGRHPSKRSPGSWNALRSMYKMW